MKSEKGLVAVLFALSFLVANGADGTWAARSGVGTGGTNWALWSDTENWDGGTVASGSDATATLTPAAGKYIQLPSSLSLKDIVQGTVASPVVLVGDGTYDFNPYATGAGPKNCYLYCPFDFSIMKPSDNYAGFMSGCQFCGPVGAKKSGPDPRFSGTVSFRYDLYATEAGEEREFNTFPCNISMDVGRLRFIAPHGSSVALSSRWVQTAGSPFLKLADGETAHVLSAGTTVTGDGVPEGAFLKRVFPDGSIELSAAPTTSAAANTLTFAAFNAKTYAKLPSDKRIAYYNGTGQRVICVQKYRDEDDFTVRIPYFQILYAGAANNQRYYRFSTEEGFLPGKVEFGYVHANYNPVVYLEDCHLEIYQNTETSGNVAIRMDGTERTARLTVTNGLTRTFGRLVYLAGTLVKDGGGTLAMSVTNNTAVKIPGSIIVKEGTFAPSFMDAGTNVIASLTVKSGARFVIPEGVVLKPTSLSVEEGAIFGGAGRLVCPGLSVEDILGLVLEDGVSLDDGRSGSDFSIEVLRGAPSPAEQDGDSVWLFDTNALLRVNGTGVFDILAVGGGGGGGAKNGGGGGGGGVIYTQQMVIASGVYPVSVGMGGMGAPDKRTDNTSGGNSGVFGLLAYGGGAGGTYSRKRNIPGGYTGEPFSGGSGGGGGAWYPGTVGTTPGADGVEGQGFAGGSSTNGASHFWCAGGGGGGAGAPGGYAWSNGSYLYGGNGGDGVHCEIYGSKYYGGGGGGGVTSKTAATGENFCGGTGGGGHGGVTAGDAVKSGENGEDGLGGGGGGGSGYLGDSEGGAGGNGGRGVVILRWRQPEVAENDVPESPIATGGDIHRRGGYAIHKFSADGSFALSEPTLVDILLVGGGGGGGSRSGGGGGGGGVLIVSNAYLLAGSYSVTVGMGGAGASGAGYKGASGTDSVVSFGSELYDLRAYGGGGGGSSGGGLTGASGGGGGAPYTTQNYLFEKGGAGTPGQGFAGGIGIHGYTGNVNTDWPTAQGGGGGGAGAPGGDGNADSKTPGNGGNGMLCDFSGSPVWYGGGGGGGSAAYAYAATEFYIASGGIGGGGRGGAAITPYPSTSAGENGVDGLGGGGGGSGGACDGANAGGRGGNGVVIIRYRIRKPGFMLIVQ